MHLLGKAMDKSFWREVREKDCYKKYRDELFDWWDKSAADDSMESLKYSEFKLFWITGDRKQYQTPYYARRRALSCSALLSLIYPD